MTFLKMLAKTHRDLKKCGLEENAISELLGVGYTLTDVENEQQGKKLVKNLKSLGLRAKYFGKSTDWSDSHSVHIQL